MNYRTAFTTLALAMFLTVLLILPPTAYAQIGLSAVRNAAVELAFGAYGTVAQLPIAPTTITAHNPNPSNVRQVVIIDFTVQGAKYRPSGTVTVTSSDGLSCQGVLTLGDPSTGSCAITFTRAGVKSLTASYSGDDTYAPSTSATASHTVNGPSEVPEGDTLLLFGGGIGGLGVWLRYQWSKRRRGRGHVIP
jgi:hypothetical protein